MPNELIVILGAEACLLVFTMTMTLRARRMDVLSGRFFERPVISPAGNRYSPQRVRRYAHDLLRLTRTWIDVDRIGRSDFSQWRSLARSLRSSCEDRPGLLLAPGVLPHPLPVPPVAKPYFQRLVAAPMLADTPRQPRVLAHSRPCRSV